MLKRYQRLAVAGDAASAALGATLALIIRFGGEPTSIDTVLSVLIVPLWVGIVAARRGYEQRFLGTGPEEYRLVAGSGVFLFTAIAVGAFSVKSEVARGYVFLAVPFTVLLTLLVRHWLRGWIFRLRAQGVGLQRVLVIGRADAVVNVIEKLDHEPQHGLVPVGACIPPIGIMTSHVHGVPVVGDTTRVLEAVDESRADVVAVVSHPDMSGHALRRLSWALEERDIELVVSPGIIEVAGPRLSIRPIAGLSLLHLERPAARGGKMLLKGAVDRTLGLFLLLVLAPIMVLAGVGVRFSSRGTALFRQTRVGAAGREFTMYKFRSMVADAERKREDLLSVSDGNEMLFKMRQDPRVTPIGKVLRRFSLDELPQLINVVRGDMSLVGPRPPLPDEVAGYSDDAVRRLKVRPGMTGLWQVSGRSDLSWEESLRLDLRYADNWSLALDALIMWRTLRAVFRGAGAY